MCTSYEVLPLSPFRIKYKIDIGKQAVSREDGWKLVKDECVLFEEDIRIIKPTKLNPLEANVLSFVLPKTKIFLQKCQNNETEAFCLKFTRNEKRLRHCHYLCYMMFSGLFLY